MSEVAYRFKVSYRLRRENLSQLENVMTQDKDGKQICRKVNGKPYTEYMRRSIHFNNEQKARRAYERLKNRESAKFVKLKEGEFKVEEVQI